MKELEGREYFPDCRFNNSDLSESIIKRRKNSDILPKTARLML